MNAYMQRVLDEVKARNGSEKLFLQTVEEVFQSLEPIVEKHPEYEKYAVLERMCEPDRQIQFRVTWVDDAGKPFACSPDPLLEAMQEHQVTIGDETFKLPSPFLVMATQNPIEQEGTYQLPEAQVDRFLLKVIIDYPTLEEEKLIIRENIQGGLPEVTPVTSAEEILKARKIVNEVYLDEKIEQYIADIVFASRYPERYGLGELKDMITFGGSPRASISLAKAARAYAFIKHRGYVIPEDVRAVAHDVLRHRIGLSYEAEASNVTSEEIVSRIINKVEVP